MLTNPPNDREGVEKQLSTYDPNKITTLSNEKEVVSRIIAEYTEEIEAAKGELEEKISSCATAEYVDAAVSEAVSTATEEEVSEVLDEVFGE